LKHYCCNRKVVIARHEAISTLFSFCPGRTGFFLFDNKKKQKLPAENFSFEVSGLVLTSYPEKFVRPDLSRTEIEW